MDPHLFRFEPDADLAPFIESIWGVRTSRPAPAEAVLPNGAVELMVSFGPTQRVVGHGNRTLNARHGEAWLAGIQDRRLIHASEEGADHIAVSFRPGGAHAFFELPMAATRNLVVDLDDLVGSAAASLRDRLGAQKSDRLRARVFQDWLRRRQAVDPAFPTVRRAVDLLRDRGDFRMPVGAVCEALGLSNRHLIATFRRTIGLPPKSLARVERFRAVLEATGRQRTVDWVDLALRYGYADQSHLAREFRLLGSVTPRDFLSRRTGSPVHMAIDGASCR